MITNIYLCTWVKNDNSNQVTLKNDWHKDA